MQINTPSNSANSSIAISPSTVDDNNFFYFVADEIYGNISSTEKQKLIMCRKIELINTSTISYLEDPKKIAELSAKKRCYFNIMVIENHNDNFKAIEQQITNNLTKNINLSTVPINFAISLLFAATYNAIYFSTHVAEKSIRTRNRYDNHYQNEIYYKNILQTKNYYLYNLLTVSFILTLTSVAIDAACNKLLSLYCYHQVAKNSHDYHNFIKELTATDEFTVKYPFADIDLAKTLYAFKQFFNDANDTNTSYNLYKAIVLAVAEEWIYNNQLDEFSNQDSLTRIIQNAITIILSDYNFTVNLSRYNKTTINNQQLAIDKIAYENKIIKQQENIFHQANANETNHNLLSNMKAGIYSILGANSLLYINRLTAKKIIYKIYNPVLQIEATTNSIDTVNTFLAKMSKNIIFKKII